MSADDFGGRSRRARLWMISASSTFDDISELGFGRSLLSLLSFSLSLFLSLSLSLSTLSFSSGRCKCVERARLVTVTSLSLLRRFLPLTLNQPEQLNNDKPQDLEKTWKWPNPSSLLFSSLRLDGFTLQSHLRQQ